MFNAERRKAQQKAARGQLSEKALLKERFKPLNQMGRGRKKEKVDDDIEAKAEYHPLRTSNISDESMTAGTLSSDRDKPFKSYQNANTKASSGSSSIEEEAKSLPPVYVDIQEELDEKFQQAEELFA